MKRVVVVGGKGFIASHLKYPKNFNYIVPSDYNVSEWMNHLGADVIINATGFCGKPNIDACELQKVRTYEANVILPCLLAAECEKRSIHMIHLGSGCIYYGKSPSAMTKYQINCLSGEFEATPLCYNNIHNWVEDTGWKETDVANPESFYSKTKYACDLILGSMPNVTTLRLRMPISSKDNPRNLLNKLLGYSKIVEEPNSVTFLDDLVNAIDWVIENEKTGIYHVTSPKPLTHSVLLEEYKKYVPTHTYERITKEELRAMVKAPRSNCILDSRKIVSEGFKFEDTDTRVHETIKKYVENRNIK